MAVVTTTDGRSPLGVVRSTGGLIALCLMVMWAVEGLDTFVFGDRLQQSGIQPRQARGLDGILWAPFLHSGWRHLISNTIPFAVLGGLVAVRGRGRWVTVTALSALLGGSMTWLFAGSGNHLGASGVVFGYLGALVGAAIFERRPASIAPALVAILLYSGMVVGFVPQTGLSWEGHVFGAIAGLTAAKFLAEPDSPRPEDEDDGYWSGF